MKKTSLQIQVFFQVFLYFILTSCSSPTKYKEAEGSGPGYRSEKLSENRYRVIFKGNENTSKDQVEAYLLYRSAELTEKMGYDYFIVHAQGTDVIKDFEPVTPPPSPYNMSPNRFRPFPYEAQGFPWSAPTATGVQLEKQYEAIAQISMHKEKPKDSKESVYKTDEVLQSLKEQIRSP